MILLPDVEALTIQTLNAGFSTAMPGVRWSTRIPDPRPAQFGRLFRIGGVRETLISEQAALSLEGWGESEVTAFAILRLARGILHDQDGALFGVVEGGGPANLPDPLSSQSRYTMTVTVRVRADIN